MITLEENEMVKSDNDLTSEEDIQGKIDSLRQALNTGELPEDLKNFINSLEEAKEEDTEYLDDESDEEPDLGEDPFDVEIDESLVDDDVDDKDDVSLDELNSLF